MEKERILDEVFSVIPDVTTKCVYIYDHDKENPAYLPVLAITADQCGYCHYHNEQIIITRIDEHRMFEILPLLNPLVTEPLLIGEQIYGEDFRFYRQALFELEAKNEALNYLISMAREYYKEAARHYRSGHFRLVLPELYFTVLFSVFARHYLIRKRTTTIERILMGNQWPLLNGTHALIGQCYALNDNIYRQLLAIAEKFMEDASIQVRLNAVTRLPPARQGQGITLH